MPVEEYLSKKKEEEEDFWSVKGFGHFEDLKLGCDY